LGQEEVGKMLFLSDYQEIVTLLSQTEEFRQILLTSESFPSQDYYNTIPLLTHLRIENAYPEPEQLSEFGLALTTFLAILRFFNEERSETYPNLAKLVGGNTKYEVGNTNIQHPGSGNFGIARSRICDPEYRGKQEATRQRDLITSILDDKSNIRSSASKELARIRGAVNRLQGGVEKRMKQIFAEVRKSGWTDEDADVTLREGRLVIPFRSAHKRKIQGVVHDESATGQTVYVEPIELFEMNNEIRELYYAERREIIRILTDVADQIRPHIEEFTEMNWLLGRIDFIRAKARFALQVGAALCTRVEDQPHLQWFQAVHPLLFLAHKKAKKTVVPQDISLTSEKRVLVISGPNAGGKSICLKTVGLLQYMLQCGLLPLAREDSEFGIFRQIMIDIGDEQSLENDLSTYTSKLINMKYFLTHLDDHSIFLIDEMGTGTDPSVGGAIAEAGLEAMAGTGAYGVVTTHYSNLKLLADRKKYEIRNTKYEINSAAKIQNGAMLFDTRNMKPLYKLKQGKPGSSFAIEIATSIGFPKEELRKASELIGGSQLDFEQQLQDLEQEKEEVTKRSNELHVADEFLDELIMKYEKMNDEMETSKKEILEKAREEAHQLLKDSNKLIERTIKEIRESQADKERTKEARSLIRMKNEELRLKDETTKETKDNTKEHEGSSLEPFVQPFESFVVKKNSNLNRGEAELGGAKPSYINIINDKQASFTLTLDLRGKRADEAFLELQRFIDDAILLSIKEVRILHGKGTGALREVTRNYLNSVKEVKTYQDEALERGGSGVTVVTL
ncbi:MAG: Smr/MutS family protein, partial [Bacteroidia bacterium]|nr:Smr/MutS family protein [Bacteroidia bacterium]